jgi:radical SAM superfamily enzyme YgiQ (UPF0313 family)
VRVLLINNGPTGHDTATSARRIGIPRKARERLKPYVALLPTAVQQRLLGGFGLSEKRFPLGLGYLSAMLKQQGHTVRLVDRFAQRGEWIADDEHFDFVGVYASSPFFSDCLEVLRLLDARNYRGPIAFGGPHPAVFPRTIPPRVDYVVQGEGEYIIHDLVEGKYPRGKIIRTPRIDDLDALPRADFRLFLEPARGYDFGFGFTNTKPIFNLCTSRSCPYQCSFCGVRDIWGRLYRAQSAERIFDDICHLKTEFGCAGVYFREDLFTADHKRVRALSELLIRHRTNIEWACETRVDAGSDEELVALMAKSGCRGFYIGAEAGSQRMLDIYNKEIDVAQIYKTCALARKYGIAVYMSLIVGHPEERMSDKLAIARLLQVTKPEMSGLAPYRAEFARHGVVDYPEYEEREVVSVKHENSTWSGQSDRFRYLQIGLPKKSPKAETPTAA